jgi:hypothetical protein
MNDLSTVAPAGRGRSGVGSNVWTNLRSSVTAFKKEVRFNHAGALSDVGCGSVTWHHLFEHLYSLFHFPHQLLLVFLFRSRGIIPHLAR